MILEELQAENDRLRAENAVLLGVLEERAATRELGLALAAAAVRLGPMPNADLDAAIGGALGLIGAALRADRGFVVLFARDGGYERTHEWHAAGVTPLPAALRSDRLDPFRALAASRDPVIVSESRAGVDGVDRALLAQSGAKSLLLLPMLLGGAPIGVVGFDSLAAEQSYPAPVLGLLRTAGSMFSSVVVRLRQDAQWDKLVGCLLAFGPSPRDNIQRLTALVGELLGGLAAFYDRFDDGLLRSWATWRAPQGHGKVSDPAGRLCTEVIRHGHGEVVVVRDLQRSTYASSDPNVAACGLATYVGRAIALDGRAVGALSVVFGEDVDPTPDERRLLGAIANAVAAEELRAHALATLVQSERAARVVFDHSLDGILITGGVGDGGVRSANPAACAMLGYAEEELVGLHRADLHLVASGGVGAGQRTDHGDLHLRHRRHR